MTVRPVDVLGAALLFAASTPLSAEYGTSTTAVSRFRMECVQRKLAPASECSCLYPQELSRVRSAYERTLRQHPDWKNKVVSYTLEGRTYAVSFGGVNRQLQRKCPHRK